MTDPAKSIVARINGAGKTVIVCVTIGVGALGWFRSYITDDVRAQIASEARIKAVDGEISDVKERVESVEIAVERVSDTVDRVERIVETLASERPGG